MGRMNDTDPVQQNGPGHDHNMPGPYPKGDTIMMWDDYRNQVKSDAAECLEDSWEDGWMDCIDLGEQTIEPDILHDDLWDEDGVTGNGSGSYTFSRAAAIENVRDVIWSDEFADMIAEYGWTTADLFERGPEAIDVAIRCHLLGEVCWDVAGEFARAHGFTVVE